MSRARHALWAGGLTLDAVGTLFSAHAQVQHETPAPDLTVEVAVTGLVRPTQIAFTPTGTLVVLSHGLTGQAAGELTWVEARGTVPVDASAQPRHSVLFDSRTRQAVLGSLAVDPRSGDLLLGEENGNRVYRLGPDRRLSAIAVGLHHLVGGSALTVDGRGRFVILDFVSPETQLRLETQPPLALFDWASPEGYQGPLVFRLDPTDPAPLPRRLDLVAPFFPRAWLRRPVDASLPRFIAVAPLPNRDLFLLSSLGELFRLTEAGDLGRVARLPAGHYHRINMATAPDGGAFVTTGFHLREIVRVSPDGHVTTVARGLGDPGGLAVDDAGRLYVAETALHRILRIMPAR